jgi:hypothetical protein
MERVFGTLEKRLPQELRLARIKTVAAANRCLRERFIPDHNARLAVPAAEPGSAFTRYEHGVAAGPHSRPARL